MNLIFKLNYYKIMYAGNEFFIKYEFDLVLIASSVIKK